MMTFVFVAAIVALLALCAVGRGWLAWVVAGAIVLAGWFECCAPNAVVFTIVVGLFALLAIVFGVKVVRRALFAELAMKAVGNALPRMSDTEKAALDAGTVWWDAELFSGSPRWKKLVEFDVKRLSSEERHFLEGPVRELCGMCIEHEIERRGDLTPETWKFIRSKGFMGMIIPREFGGLGFSAIANSAVVAKLSSRSVAAAVSVMVPNSLGPAELLFHYGTDEQKKHWLPRLARGEEVPCFALTEPGAGSDAASMTSHGVVCRGTFEGREVVGMKLNWDKRYITLAPIATVVGLAFKLRDPEHLLGANVDLGITCALIPRDTPGVEIGERHDPLGVPFLNGPTRGHDVFVPLEFIIGGSAMAGQGWRMLMQCLSAGRGVSLPALSVGACELAARVAGAHATVREQFGLPLGRFEAIEDKLGRIGGLTYLTNAGRLLTLGAIDSGEKPSVLTAIMKCYATENMRTVVNDAMDVLGGAAICRGPRNVMSSAYRSVPIGITVEGANVLTRTLIVFGQGAIRCHPFVQDEMAAVAAHDSTKFDAAFFGHVNLVVKNAARSLVFGVTNGAGLRSPVEGAAGEYYAKVSRLASAFALSADVAMATLGGNLKRKENLCGRLADALAHLYLASAALKRFYDDGSPTRDVASMRWSVEYALHRTEQALYEFVENLPNRPAAWALCGFVFPLGRRTKPPSDRRTAQVAHGLLDDRPERQALTEHIYLPPPGDAGLGRLEATLTQVVAAQAVRAKLKDAQRSKKLEARGGSALLDEARTKSVISESERTLVENADRARENTIQVDSFAFEALLSAAN